MPGGHKPKKVWASHNISGLRNQLRPSSIISDAPSHPTPPWSQAPSPNGDLEEDDDDLDLLIHFDSLKTNLQYKDECKDDAEQLEDEWFEEWDGFRSEDLAEDGGGWWPKWSWLVAWTNNYTKREEKEESEKSVHTYSITFYKDTTQCNQRGLRYIRRPRCHVKIVEAQQCYAVALQSQGKLIRFGFKSPSYSPKVHGTKLKGKSFLSPVIEPDQQPTV